MPDDPPYFARLVDWLTLIAMAAYKKGAASSAVTVEERNNFAGAGQRLGDGSLAESARRGVAEVGRLARPPSHIGR